MASVAETLAKYKSADPEQTYTFDEVRVLVEWTINNVLATDLAKARLQAEEYYMQQASSQAIATMHTLENLWDSACMAPTLQVVVDDGKI